MTAVLNGKHRLQSGSGGNECGRSVRGELWEETRCDPVEGNPGPQQGFHAVTRGEIGDSRTVCGKQNGGLAHVEPIGVEPPRLDDLHFLQFAELTLRSLPSGTNRRQTGESIDALKPERRARRKAHKMRRKHLETRTLAAHAGIDFEMNRQGAGLQSRRSRGGFKVIQLRRLPNNSGKSVLNDGCPWPGTTPPMTTIRVSGTECAGGHTFFNTGDRNPSCPLPEPPRGQKARANGRAHPLLRDSHELRVGRERGSGEIESFFEGANAGFNPAGVRLHAKVLDLVYGMARQSPADEAS